MTALNEQATSDSDFVNRFLQGVENRNALDMKQLIVEIIFKSIEDNDIVSIDIINTCINIDINFIVLQSIKVNNENMVNRIINKHKRNIDVDSPYIKRAASYCVENNYKNYLKMLIFDLNLDTKDLLINNSSMLNVAVNKGYEEIVILLITRCEHDIDQLDINNNSLLHMAVNNNNYRMTYLLLHMDISPNLFNKDNVSPILLAAKNGNNKILKLMAKFVDVDTCDKTGNTVLNHAIINKHFSTVSVLINELLASKHINNVFGTSALEFALQVKDNDIINLLLD
jgi:ankyrin repeat protein